MKMFKFIWLCVRSVFVYLFLSPAAGPLALIKFGQIGIAEARKKVAGVVFSRNTAGAYMRQKVSPVQPRTVAQLGSRTRFGDIAADWRGLTDLQRKVWIANAPNVQHTNVFGDNMPLTGFGLFTRLNNNLVAAGQAKVTDWPGQPDVDGFISFTFIANTTAGTLIVTFTPAIPADQQVIVYATSGLSAGKSFVKSEYRQIGVWDDTVITGADLAATYIAVFGALPLVGEKVFIKLRPLNEDSGFDAVPIFSSDIAV